MSHDVESITICASSHVSFVDNRMSILSSLMLPLDICSVSTLASSTLRLVVLKFIKLFKRQCLGPFIHLEGISKVSDR